MSVAAKAGEMQIFNTDALAFLGQSTFNNSKLQGKQINNLALVSPVIRNPIGARNDRIINKPPLSKEQIVAINSIKVDQNDYPNMSGIVTKKSSINDRSLQPKYGLKPLMPTHSQTSEN